MEVPDKKVLRVDARNSVRWISVVSPGTNSGMPLESFNKMLQEMGLGAAILPVVSQGQPKQASAEAKAATDKLHSYLTSMEIVAELAARFKAFVQARGAQHSNRCSCRSSTPCCRVCRA